MSPVPAAVDRFEQCTRVRAVFDLLGSGCVAFYPRLADLTGSVTAALLLGQCLYWTDRVLRQQQQVQPSLNGKLHFYYQTEVWLEWMAHPFSNQQ